MVLCVKLSRLKSYLPLSQGVVVLLMIEFTAINFSKEEVKIYKIPHKTKQVIL
jgi:hypothetical protein